MFCLPKKDLILNNIVMQNAFGQEYQTKPVNNNATPNTNYCEKTNGDLIR